MQSMVLVAKDKWGQVKFGSCIEVMQFLQPDHIQAEPF